MSSFSSSVTLGTPSRDRALEACSNSDIKTLHSMLSEQGELAGKDDDDLISLFMARAACTGQSKSLEYLFAQYPEFPLKQNSLGTVHNNIFYGQNALPIYKLLVERYPFLREWDLGEVADHLGSATMVNDLEFATYLLEVERVDASKARFFNRPVCWRRSFRRAILLILNLDPEITTYGEIKEGEPMIALLLEHGAPDYQPEAPEILRPCHRSCGFLGRMKAK